MQRIDFLGTNRNGKLFRQDASFIYRCENLALALRAAKYETGLTHVDDYDPLGGARAVVLHRPRYSWRLKRFLRSLRRNRTYVVADIDDLIFDPEQAAHSPAVRNGILSLRKVQKQFMAHNKALSLVDHVTVATHCLAEQVHRLLPNTPVTVLANTVHMSWRSEEDDGFSDTRVRKVIVYTPGTRSHDKDFKMIAPAISRFLGEHADACIRIVGHLNHDLKARPGQIASTPRVPFAKYPKRLRCGWVNLSPLEPTPFNECKSAIKVIEAGYFNIPTICSPNPDASRFAKLGAVVASTESDWFDALQSMLDESTYRRKTTDLRERTLAVADAYAQAKTFSAMLDRNAAKPSP